MQAYFWSYLILFCSCLPAAGCLFQPSPQGAEGEVPEEPWLLTAGQPAVHPSGQPGAPRMLPRDAIWTPGGPRGRVSAGRIEFFLSYVSYFTNCLWCACICTHSNIFFLFCNPLQSGLGGNGKHLTLQKALHHPSAGSNWKLSLWQLIGSQYPVYAAAAPQCLPQAGRHPARSRAALRAL